MDRNLALANHDDGFNIKGNGLTLTNNKSDMGKDDGYEYDCDDDPPCGSLSGNSASLNRDDGFNLDDQRSTTLSNNKAINNRDDGYDCDECEDVVFTNNLAFENGDNGFQDEDCDTSSGTPGGESLKYIKNRSIENAEDGFNSRSNNQCEGGVTFDGNLAQENGHDGIDIDNNSGPYTVKNNRLIKNRGTGLENDADDTAVTGNTWKKNRTDFAGTGDDGGGTVGTFTGNTPIPPATGGVTVCTPGTGDTGDSQDCT